MSDTVAYGDAPAAAGVTGDRTISMRVTPQTEGTVELRIGGMTVGAVVESGNLVPRATVQMASGVAAIQGTDAMSVTFSTYTIAATYDAASEELTLYLDDALIDTVSTAGLGGEYSPPGTWSLRLPPDSYATDLASWSSVLSFIPPGGALNAAIMALSPLGYWKLNETSGTTAVDSSGNGRDGTYTGTYTLAGAVGGDGVNHLSLDGAGSVSVPDNNVWSANNASGLTVVAFGKPTDPAGGTNERMIATKGAVSNYEWGHQLGGGLAGNINSRVWNAAGNNLMNTGAGASVVSHSVWHGFAFAHGAPVQNGAMLIYLDSGTPLTTGPISNPGTSYTNGTATVRLGWRADTPGGTGFSGGLAHVAIFAGQLNGTQIGSIMAAAAADGWI